MSTSMGGIDVSTSCEIFVKCELYAIWQTLYSLQLYKHSIGLKVHAFPLNILYIL